LADLAAWAVWAEQYLWRGWVKCSKIKVRKCKRIDIE